MPAFQSYVSINASIAWFPFASFKKEAEIAAKDSLEVLNAPFDMVMESMVHVVRLRSVGWMPTHLHRLKEARKVPSWQDVLSASD